MLLNLILMLIVVGLSFMGSLVYNKLERLLLFISLNTCCRRDRPLKQVIVKNMYSHRKRNMKTSIMFTLTMAFLIFIKSLFNLIASMIGKVSAELLGSDICIYARRPMYPLYEKALMHFMSHYCVENWGASDAGDHHRGPGSRCNRS